MLLNLEDPCSLAMRDSRLWFALVCFWLCVLLAQSSYLKTLLHVESSSVVPVEGSFFFMMIASCGIFLCADHLFCSLAVTKIKG